MWLRIFFSFFGISRGTRGSYQESLVTFFFRLRRMAAALLIALASLGFT
jgi:hypothetical protein